MAEKLKANFVDHICIAVNDVKKAEKDYIDMFGWEVAYRYVDEPEKIRVTGFMVGPTAIEIMEDTDGTGPTANFIIEGAYPAIKSKNYSESAVLIWQRFYQES